MTAKTHNTLVFGILASGLGTYCKGITYTFADGPLAGKTFTGGTPCQVQQNGQTLDAVRFVEKFKNQTVNATYETRPELADLVTEYRQYRDKEVAQRKEAQAAHAAQVAAAQSPFLAAMHAEADALVAAIPADAVRVTVKSVTWADGDDILEMEAEGVSLTYRDVVFAGTACATFPGALSPFESIRVIYITRARLQEIQAEAAAKQAKTLAAQQERAAKFAEAAATGQPVLLYSLMDDCNDEDLDCSFDDINVYAEPDGTTSEQRVHCY